MTRTAAEARPRVLVPRAPEQAGALVRALQREGLDAEVAPALRHEGLTPTLAHESYSWVVFTSATAARFAAPVSQLFVASPSGRAAAAEPSAAEPSSRPRVLAIGEKTAAALRERAIPVDLIPDDARAEGALAALLEELDASTRATSILIARAERARPVLEEGLRRAGAHVEIAALYQSLPPDAAGQARLLAAAEVCDAIALLSGAMAENVLAAVGSELLSRRAIVTIGPVTSADVRRLGLPVAAEASEPSVASLATAAARVLSSR